MSRSWTAFGLRTGVHRSSLMKSIAALMAAFLVITTVDGRGHDYLVKPFSFDELSARVGMRAGLVRRSRCRV